MSDLQHIGATYVQPSGIDFIRRKLGLSVVGPISVVPA